MEEHRRSVTSYIVCHKNKTIGRSANTSMSTELIHDLDLHPSDTAFCVVNDRYAHTFQSMSGALLLVPKTRQQARESSLWDRIVCRLRHQI